MEEPEPCTEEEIKEAEKQINPEVEWDEDVKRKA